LWLVGLGAATTCISFYYYLRILKAVFVEEPSGPSPRSVAGGVESWTVMVSAVVVVVVGCLPALLLGPLRGALAAAGF
jgi:NADH-quinone oxidoreductase subunit N